MQVTTSNRREEEGGRRRMRAGYVEVGELVRKAAMVIAP